MQAGQNPHDPLTQLNSHLGFGAMAGFNPFANMGVNPNDPNMVRPLPQLSKILDLPDAGLMCTLILAHVTDAKHVKFSSVP